MQIEGRVGEVRTTIGGSETIRQGRYAEMLVSELMPRAFYLALNNRVFHSYVQAVTVAATHNSPITAVTATPVLGLLNPPGSNKAAVLFRVAATTTSGTPAGGQFVLNAIPGINTQPSTSQTGSIFSGNVGLSTASPQGSAMKVYNNVALTALAPITANAVVLLGGATAAAAAGNGGTNVSGEDLGGGIIVPPATFVALMAGTGAGTSWIVNASWSWVETDWPL